MRLDRDAEAQDRRLQEPHPRPFARYADTIGDSDFLPPAAGCSNTRTTGTKFRLLGIGLSGIEGADQADPADLVDGRSALAEHAVDKARARFGDDAVVRGLAFERREKT